MRVLHVISSLSPRAGGAAQMVLGLSTYQARAGLDVTVCSTDVDYPSGTLPVPVNVPVERNNLKIFYFPVQFRPLLVSLPMQRWLRKEIEGFDVLHVHGLYRFPPAYAARCARIAKVPYLVCPHGNLDPFLYRQSKYSVVLKRLYERWFALPNLNAASAIHYTAEEESERAAFLKLSAPPVVIPNGIDWAAYAELPNRGRFRAQIGIGPDVPLVLFLGRINFKKGLDLLVPAFASVAQKIPVARLAIVGPDNEGLGRRVRQWCREQGMETQVYFVEHLPSDRVREAFIDADVFVLPSYTENFGITVAEAMACRCPVVISDQVNIWREVNQASAGFVVRLDTREIANAILQVLENRETAKAHGDAGRQLVQTRYTWDIVVDQLAHVYSDLQNGLAPNLGQRSATADNG